MKNYNMILTKENILALLSSVKFDQYKYFSAEEILPSAQSRII